MLTIAAAVGALGVFCASPRPAAKRLLAATSTRRAVRWNVPRPGPRTCSVGVAVALWLVSGPAAAVSALVLVGALARSYRTNRTQARHHAADEALAEALASFVAELRGGSHPAAAAARTAADCPPLAAPVFGAVAGALGIGGSVSRALTRATAGLPSLAHPSARFDRAWKLAERHGLPLADVLEAVRDDLRARARFTGRIRARMAGPRSSALILAVLPVLGILLGEAMGADPLAVLFGGGIGGVMLLLGCCLTAAGVLWADRLTGKVVAQS